MSGLPVGQKAPKIENQSTKQLLSTKGQAVLIFSSLTCSACEQLIKEINEKQIYKKIPLYILVLNKQKEIQDFSEVNKLNFELYPISQTTREKFNIVMEPFCYYLEDQVIRSKGTINSSEELLNIHSTESIS